MKTILKYELQITDSQQIKMPSGAKILCVQVQNSKPCIWAIVEPRLPRTTIVIETYGTGNPFLSDERVYIGTYQIGGFVGHVFEFVG